MKLCINFLLFLFISYQAMPTIVAFIDDETCISLVETSEKEEAIKEFKDLKFNFCFSEILFESTLILVSKSKIISKNQLTFDMFSSKIFLTPPEFF